MPLFSLQALKRAPPVGRMNVDISDEPLDFYHSYVKNYNFIIDQQQRVYIINLEHVGVPR